MKTTALILALLLLGCAERAPAGDAVLELERRVTALERRIEALEQLEAEEEEPEWRRVAAEKDD